MSGLSWITCVLQMTLMLLGAGALSRWLRPRSPGIAATIATLGLLASLALVAMTVMQVPRPLRTTIAASLDSSMGSTDASSTSPMPVRPRVLPEDPVSTTPSASGLGLGEILRQIDWNDSSIDGTKPRLLRGLQSLMLVAFCLAAFPMAMGLLGTLLLHRRSRRLAYADVITRIDQQEGTLWQGLLFRESETLVSPCITLFGGRTIYLPPGWRSWTSGELAAAVAHEVAHIRRRDAWQRLAVQCMVCVQVLHPLAIWLGRSVTLAQEMAADRDAAERLPNYTRSLSRLALRLDAASADSGQVGRMKHCLLRPGTLSVSSSHLIRRIEMLTKYPTEMGSHELRLVSKLVVIAVFAFCAAWSVRAEPPGENLAADGPAERIANLPAASLPAAEPFGRSQRAPWDELRPSDAGYASVDIAGLLRHPTFGDAIPNLVDPLVQQGWGYLVSESEPQDSVPAALLTANVDEVMAVVNVALSKQEPQEGVEHDSSFTLGSDGGKLFFKNPVSHDAIRASLDVQRIADLLEQNGTTLDDLGGKSYTEFVEFFLSKVFLDGSVTEELELSPKEKPCDDELFSQLQTGWKSVDGGIATISCALPQSLGHLEEPEDFLADAILRKAGCLAIGVDFLDNRPAYLRVALVPRQGVSPDELKADVTTLVEIGKAAAALQLADDEEEMREETECAQQVLRSLEVSVAPSEAGGDLDVVLIRGRVELEAFQHLDLL